VVSAGGRAPVGRPLLIAALQLRQHPFVWGNYILDKYIAMAARPRYGRDHSPINR
jgi:hypothetical protein